MPKPQHGGKRAGAGRPTRDGEKRVGGFKTNMGGWAMSKKRKPTSRKSTSNAEMILTEFRETFEKNVNDPSDEAAMAIAELCGTRAQPWMQSDGLPKGMILKCPECGFDYVGQIMQTTTPISSSGLGLAVVSAQGVTVMDNAKPGGKLRGVRTMLHFQCEQGHSFHMYFQFHKGHTLYGFESDPPCDAPVIWRD